MRVDSESGGVEMCDPAIKLFGTTIGVPEMPSIGTREWEKVTTKDDPLVETVEENDHIVADATYVQKNGPESIQQTCTLDEKVNTDSNSTDSNAEPEKSDNSKQEKTLKKPDKVLPCPRCSSMDTKFCYYNNYNVNQPRHFCKNCQRYWTAGGTMRNVPVGAGRRKTKNSSLHYRHLVLSSNGMHSPRVENPGLNHYQAPSCGQSTQTSHFNGSKPVLKLGREEPLCESIANVLSLARHEKKGEISTLNGQEYPKEQSCAMANLTNCEGREFSDKIARPNQNSTPASCNKSAPLHQLQCHPGPHMDMAYPWCNNSPKPVPWCATQMPFCAPAMPYPFITAPPSLWGCLVGWPSGTWNAPWLGPNGSMSPSSSTSNSASSGNHSPTLGKHCRDSSSIGDEKAEKSLWVPKTLRVDDPEEASKSSIWATLGIKHNPNKSNTDGGVFKSFRPSTRDEKSKGATQVLHANPAALSRSRTFREST